MVSETAFWVLLLAGVLCGLAGYGLARFRSEKIIKRLIQKQNGMTQELESVKVTSVQLEVALDNVEFLHHSKNQFYSSTSHDLRQPLHALSMFSSVLKKQQLNDISKQIADDISDAVLDVSREIDGLLDIARLDVDILKLNPVEIDLAAETRRVVHQFQSLAESKALELKVYANTDELVCLDRIVFDRVLRNLIDNAIKFTTKGSVQVTVGFSSAKLIRLSVVDTGIGISADDQQNIYREFYQGRNLSGSNLSGVGLGLNTVLKLISRLGGEINVESTGLHGTSVIVTIPNVKCVGEAAKFSENSEEIKQNVVSVKSVLVLESDILDGKGTIMLLESAGYDVVSVNSLSEAYEIQKTQKLDAACLEYDVGEESTFHLIDTLRSVTPDMPIVVTTSNKAEAMKHTNSSIAVLLKPVGSKALLENLENSAPMIK